MKRWLISMPVALVFTLGLFMLMALMVGHSTQRPQEKSTSMSIDIFMQEPDTDVQRRQRTVPERPKPPEMPDTPTPVTQTQSTASAQPDMPTLNLQTNIQGVMVQAPSLGDLSVMQGPNNQQAMPLFRVEPNYPPRAMRRGLEGYVVVRFTISPSGRPQDLSVVEANPPRVFEREALRALRKWKYEPKVVNGEAVAQPGQQIKLEFNLR
ncbi:MULTISPECIES: energy transducer TonB [Salinivibrio]|uniref:Protein TonB n=2 Tax=Salinivibrio TaxID=51366 RepID=A0ABY7LH81_9GAMM|nr:MULTISPECIES: energy transducer TonB [Salinivibrio]OOF10108.1 energy transducer TonB [Salinivibrio sp. PR919]OOF10585.1 energy transducer TonB [Salinivibrio sp. PR5]OOF17669.1 energy transducer TonB [Salinivibrio sp. PR932]OOF30828.1 energy transducer TonB [Salinivibrio proteolyticus]PCE65303.1 energy transducer TonB [Salinivibrio sp. YCSC6]